MASTTAFFYSLFLLPSLFSAVVLSDLFCTLPNNQLAEDAVNCFDPSGRITGLCCQPGDLCLNNTLCASKAGNELNYYRGACIPTGPPGNNGCPNFCLDPAESDRMVPVYPCPGDRSQRLWFCGDASLNCFALFDNTNVYATAGTSPEPSIMSIPIGVGVAVGTSVVLAASVLGFFYLRKRHREAPVRAETPPPFEFSTIDNLNQAPGWLGPAYGPKPGVPEMQGNGRGVAEIGGTAPFELP